MNRGQNQNLVSAWKAPAVTSNLAPKLVDGKAFMSVNEPKMQDVIQSNWEAITAAQYSAPSISRRSRANEV